MHRTTYATEFYCRQSKASKKTGLSPIEMSISLNGTRIFFNLPIKADPRNFDKQRKRGELSSYLSSIQNKATTAIFELTERDTAVTAEKVRDYLKNGYTQAFTISDLWESFLTDLQPRIGVSLKPLVYKKYELVRDSFLAFLSPTTDVKEVSKGDIQRWSSSLSKSLKNSTIAGYLTKLKTVFIYAIDNGYIKVNPFNGIKIQHPREQIEYLTEKEIQSIINFNIDIPRLMKVKDLFLFQCFTGLSYIDMAQLSYDDIQEKGGVYYISKPRQKTGVEFTTVILPEGVSILKRYDKLPMLSNQKFNGFLKELAAFTGIKKNLHSHLARKTYATLLLNKGVRVEVVARCLGHSNTKITQQYYARLQDSTILKEVSSIFWYSISTCYFCYMDIINQYSAVVVTLKSHNYYGQFTISPESVDDILDTINDRAADRGLPIEYGENTLVVNGDLTVSFSPVLDYSDDTIADAFGVTFD